MLIYVTLRRTRADRYAFVLEMMFPMPKEAITSQNFGANDSPTILPKLLAALRGLMYS